MTAAREIPHPWEMRPEPPHAQMVTVYYTAAINNNYPGFVCPFCGVSEGEPCRNTDGSIVSPHRDRRPGFREFFRVLARNLPATWTVST